MAKSELTKIETPEMVYYIDAMSQIQGPWLGFYYNGDLHSYREYVDGELHGLVFTCDTDGKITMVANFAHGVAHGRYTVWSNYYKLVTDVHYHHGVTNGEVTTRRVKDNQLMSIEPYIDGRRHGRSLIYTDGGIISHMRTYKNDKLHGLSKVMVGEREHRLYIEGKVELDFMAGDAYPSTDMRLIYSLTHGIEWY